jgi:hypothetical protein
MDRSQGHDPGPRPMARIAYGSQGHGPGPGSRARLRAKARAGARGQGHDPGPRPMARIAYGSQGQGPGQDQGQDPGPRPWPRARARGKGQDPAPGSPAATSANRGEGSATKLTLHDCVRPRTPRTQYSIIAADVLSTCTHLLLR